MDVYTNIAYTGGKSWEIKLTLYGYLTDIEQSVILI